MQRSWSNARLKLRERTLSGERMNLHSRSPILLALLIAISMRAVLGAPCCLYLAKAVGPNQNGHVIEAGHSGHHDHNQSDHAGGHSEHADDPSANPCCSACGPTLPSDPAQLANVATLRSLPCPTPIRVLATRPPFPAYEATGPPALI